MAKNKGIVGRLIENHDVVTAFGLYMQTERQDCKTMEEQERIQMKSLNVEQLEPYIELRGAIGVPSKADFAPSTEANVFTERICRQAVVSDQKKYWKEAFDCSIRKLMVDFELTETPGARLRHLDCVHNWYQVHGGTKTRQQKQPPRFPLVPQEGEEPRPGSARNLPSLGHTALGLSAAYVLNTPRKTRGS